MIPFRIRSQSKAHPGADYEFAVTESLEKSPMFDATVDPNDTIDRTSATGQVRGGGRDSYVFSGKRLTEH
jgi:hypothetical protein